MGHEWYVVYGEADGTALSCDGPFDAGSDALYACDSERTDEGYEVVAMLPKRLVDMLAVGAEAMAE